MTLVLFFIVATVTGATNKRTKNSLTASRHENATEQKRQEMVNDNTLRDSFLLEEWIAGRDNWEQK